MIPRKVHFIWVGPDFDNQEAPALKKEYQENMQLWKRMNPGVEIRLWDDASMKKLIQSDFPEMEAVYKSYKKPVMKADLARVLILNKEGGIYADLDVVPKKPIEGLLKKSDGKEDMQMTMNKNRGSNYFLMSPPKSKFSEKLIAEGKKLYQSKSPLKKIDHFNVMLYGLGPPVYNRMAKKENMMDREDSFNCTLCATLNGTCKENQGYFKHNYDATWSEYSTGTYCSVERNLWWLVPLVIAVLVLVAFVVRRRMKLKKRKIS